MTWLELGMFVGLTVFVMAWIVSRGRDEWIELRHWYRRRRGAAGAFPVLPLPALPHEDDGPGTYLVSGVLERSGTRTRFEVEASGVPDALRKATERGVSPADVTKRRPQRA